MPALLIALPILLIALFGLATALTAYEEQLAKEGEDSGGLWQTITGGLVGLFGVAGIFTKAAAGAVRAIISRLAAAKMPALTRYFQSQASLAGLNSRTLASFAGTVADGFDRLITVTMPDAINRAVRPVGRTARQALRIARSGRTAALAALAAAAVVAGKVGRLGRRVNVLDHTLEALRRFARGIDRRLKALTRRMSKVEKAVTAAAIAGVAIRAILRRWPWMACRRLTRKGTGLFSRICGLNTDLFDTLMADLLIVGGALSVVEFVEDLQAIEDEALDFFTSVIPELPDLPG